jgi:hypothetical protein
MKGKWSLVAIIIATLILAAIGWTGEPSQVFATMVHT